jgi:hypothetical protein
MYSQVFGDQRGSIGKAPVYNDAKKVEHHSRTPQPVAESTMVAGEKEILRGRLSLAKSTRTEFSGGTTFTLRDIARYQDYFTVNIEILS